ncbi:RNA polymerase II, partial [Butyricicoccus sp. 1XD8-22]
MKYAISFFIVLLLIVSGLIFFQFQVYSNNPDVAEEKFSYTQEIEINYRGDSLDIRQHFKNLPNKEINIKW